MRSVLRVGSGVTTQFLPGNDAAHPASRLVERVLLAIGVVLCVTYAVQLWSPLRLNGDVIVLLGLASSAARGAGMTLHGQPTHYPPGYPLMVAALERLGIANSATLVLLNLFWLAVGAVCADRVLRRQFSLSATTARAVCTCALLSYVVIKHSTLPLSDLPYFGLSLLSLACLNGRSKSGVRAQFALPVVAAFAAALLAIATRTIGVALLPAIAWRLWRETRAGHVVGRFIARHRRLSIALVGLVVAVVGIAAPRVLYIREAARVYRTETGSPVRSQLDYRSSEIGEMLANLPESKMPARLRPLTVALGAVGLALLVGGFWVRRRRLAPADVYLAGYCAILAVWPYRDARFWLPVVPLLLAYFVVAIREMLSAHPARVAFAGYFVWMLLTGAAALAYSTVLSLSGPSFADRFGDGSLRGTYRYALGDSVAQQDVNADALAILREFGRHRTADRVDRSAARPMSASR